MTAVVCNHSRRLRRRIRAPPLDTGLPPSTCTPLLLQSPAVDHRVRVLASAEPRQPPRPPPQSQDRTAARLSRRRCAHQPRESVLDAGLTQLAGGEHDAPDRSVASARFLPSRLTTSGGRTGEHCRPCPKAFSSPWGRARMPPRAIINFFATVLTCSLNRLVGARPDAQHGGIELPTRAAGRERGATGNFSRRAAALAPLCSQGAAVPDGNWDRSAGSPSCDFAWSASSHPHATMDRPSCSSLKPPAPNSLRTSSSAKIGVSSSARPRLPELRTHVAAIHADIQVGLCGDINPSYL
ncbi:hypothetical protein BDV95DRAFT_92133 [Massariosphaeria phaeospora]|uniref:Uncharacterized protein n=1 Tax=Massariosphaeria phaeospora TaxID=100035 RepID=A0A7C8M7J2_9PLEO|nr:hypothetical protein BDV95DRAFT_92133 [Massariosphaeria phaeospora]